MGRSRSRQPCMSAVARRVVSNISETMTSDVMLSGMLPRCENQFRVATISDRRRLVQPVISVSMETVRRTVCEAEATCGGQPGNRSPKWILSAARGAVQVRFFCHLASGAHQREVDELGGGLFVGEVPAGLDRLADLAVQALDCVGGV